MRSVKIAVTMDSELLKHLDHLVEEKHFPNRSQAVQQAVRDKLQRMKKSRLARECAKLDAESEKALADDW